MFDENFSFLFPNSTPFSEPSNSSPPPTSSSTEDISPFSSRCSSPVLRPTQLSLAVRTRDDRFNSDRSSNNAPRSPPTMIAAPRHPSITALTSDFQTQASFDAVPSSSRSSTSSPYSSVSTPSTPLSDLDLDIDIADPLVGPDDALSFPPAPHRSASCSGFEDSMWDLSVASLSSHPTSYPLEHPLPAFALKRRQRQALGRLQCLTKRAPDLSMLIEECHPSSMAPVPVRDASGRTKSVGCAGGRIEKDKSRSISGTAGGLGGIGRRLERIRKRGTK